MIRPSRALTLLGAVAAAALAPVPAFAQEPRDWTRDMEDISAPLGTTIEIEGDVGLTRVGS